MPKHRRSSSSPRRAALSSVAVAAAVISGVALAGPSAAAKGGANASSLGLVVLSSADRTAETSVAVTHGDEVTFDVKTAADLPFVGLRCWQGENFVYDAYVGYFPGYYDPTPSFTLDSSYWAEGVDASCTARLIEWNRQGRETLLATTTFSVAG